MPGMVGGISLSGDQVNLGLVEAMRDAIRHQDWYRTDDYVHPNQMVAISRVHLGMINEGKRPYVANHGKIKVFLHGEIYNDEVADADPLAFIASLYKKKGLYFASSLNGSYIIVIVDEGDGRVLIANDRIAAKPLFYFDDGRTFYFGAELKSLLLLPSLQRKLNQVALTDFLANGQFTREHTLIEGLKTLDNATVLQIKPGTIGVTQHKYWIYDLEKDYKVYSLAHYQARLAELIRQAVKRRLRTDNTYGVLLSGGYDSRGILGCYLEERGGQNLETISWGREENIPNSDCMIARKLAQKLEAHHRFYKLTAEEVIINFRNFVFLGEGLTGFAESYDVFRRIKEQQGIDILLRGDECFGWDALLVHDEHTMFRRLNLKALQYIKPYQRILKPTYYKLFCKFNVETIKQISASCPAKKLHNRKDFFYLNLRLKYFINPLNYVKTFSMESLTPFLDYDILDFVSALPVKHRLGKSLYRKTIVGMFPDLFEKMAQRRNDIDWGASFKNSPELQRFVYAELLDESNVLTEFIDPDSLKRELDAFFLSNTTTPKRGGIKGKARSKLLKLSGKLPTIYNFAHRTSYYGRKWMGKSRDTLLPEHMILRLLILKVWGDVFLNDYPVYRE